MSSHPFANAGFRLGFNNKLVSNMGITLVENVLTKGLNFLIILILARTLGPEVYGQYSFVFVTMALCSALFDFGMDNTAVRFASRDKQEKEGIFGIYLLLKLGTLLVLTLIFWFGGQGIFTLLNKAEVARYIPYLIIGLIGESLFFINDIFLQANQQFKLRAILNTARYAASLAYIWVLLSLNMMVLEYVFYVYLIPLVFSILFLGKYFDFIKAYLTHRIPDGLLKEMGHYQKWMFVYSMANNLLGRVDIFLLAFWVGYHQIGIYNAAFQMCSIVAFLPLVMGKVLLPALAELGEEEVFETTSRVIKTSCWIALIGALMIPLTQFVIPLLLGDEYVAAIPVLQVLLLAFLAGLITMPYDQALYAMGRPKTLTFGRYAQLIVVVIFSVLTIPILGVMAAALTALAGRLLYLLYVRKNYNDLFARYERRRFAAEAFAEAG